MNSDTEARKMVAPTGGGYDPPPQGEYETPSVTATSSSGTVEIEMKIKLNLDPDKLRCLQDQGITCTSNVVT